MSMRITVADLNRPGAGGVTPLPHIHDYRGTSVQVCGLYPFVAGGTPPPVGVPLGRATDGTGAVCADPISWFKKGLISAPSAMVLGLNGLGKSSLIRRMVLGGEAFGIHSMVVGDVKGEYVDVIDALGGQIISIGHGKTGLNPLDGGNADEAAEMLRAAGHVREAQEVTEAAHERKKQLVCSLIQIIRRQAPSDREETIVDAAIRVLEETQAGTPTLVDVLRVVQEGPEPLHAAALDKGKPGEYERLTNDLEASLQALLMGRFGALFAAKKTVSMRMDASVVFDVSSLMYADEDLQAAVLLSCWSYGFATVEVSQVLADTGLIARQRYQLIMDELWRILRSSPGMVERVDSLTRLNRTVGVGQIMITHSVADFQALPSVSDRQKAQGFIERSKMLFVGGVPPKEVRELRSVMAFSRREEALVSSWNAPGEYDPITGGSAAPIGRGKFLLKTSDAPAFAFQVDFTPAEYELSNTNKRW